MRIFVLVLAMLLIVSAPSAAALAAGDSLTEWEKIDEYVESQMKEGQIPGLALGIVEGNETVYLKGYGMADGSGPVTPQTPFLMGSIGKTLTALAIRQLANQGLVAYDAPVQQYIPWFTLADGAAAKAIRIIDLINHRSGLSTASGVTPAAYNGKYSIEQLVHRLASVVPNRPVGQSAEYSNLNFIILGLVVETVSGMKYEDYIKQNILDPLGMKNSYPSMALAGSRMAQGHYVAYGITVPNNEPVPTGQVPAGFQVTSAEDLARYASLYLTNGYLDGRSIVPANALAERNASVGAFDPQASRYGVYWVEESGNPQGYLGYYGHAGATNGFTSVMLVNPQANRAIIVLANCRNNNCYPEINAQTIGNGIASIFNTGLIPPPTQHSKPGLWINITAAAVLLGLIVFRAVWAKRFRRTIGRGALRRAIALLSFVALDVLLPIAVLAGLPLFFDCTWAYLLNSNMELWWLVMAAAVILGGIGFVKVLMMAIPSNRLKKRIRCEQQTR